MTVRVIAAVVCALAGAAESADAALPLAFERNTGQAGAEVQYLSRGAGYSILFSPGEAVLASAGGTVRMEWPGANRQARIHARGEASGTANYLTGRREEWRTGIPLYSAIQYDELYPGIDLVFYGSEGRLEYDFILRPGADPARIRIRFDGAEDLRLDGGDLVAGTAGGELRHRRPRVYQERPEGRVEVNGEYVLSGPDEAGFRVAHYDRGRALVIDPVLSYSTYLGGSGDDRAWGIAVDAAGCAYVAGETWSANFPRSTRPAPASGNQEAFVVKLNAAGTGIVYATFFGGRSRDSARAIALDAAGNAYIAGFTYSTDFPTTVGAYRTSAAGQEDAFVAKLNPAGTGLVYSTILGGAGSDFATGIAVDAGGNAYVSGYTSSTAFPVTASAAQKTFKGGYQDGFAVKLNATGTGLVYATYIGGSGNDVANGIAVDSAGFAHLTGYTDSTDFPVRNALRAAAAGQGDAFVVKVNPGGEAFAYATYLGGRSRDAGNAIAVDGAGNAYVAGTTYSIDFPVTAGTVQAANRGSYDAFVAKLTSAGTALVYSTYLGGESTEEASSISVDGAGNAHIAGSTNSTSFPIQAPAQQAYAGGTDAFVAVLNAAGTGLLWSTYLGGAGEDRAAGVALHNLEVWVTGSTMSLGFPVTQAAYRAAHAGSTDAFVARLLQLHDLPPVPVAVTPPYGSGGSQLFTISYSDPGGYDDISWAQVIFAPTPQGPYGCIVFYSRTFHLFDLINDTLTGAVGPIAPGTSGNIQNSHCILDASHSSVSVGGNSIILQVAITFKSTFAGAKRIYASVADRSGSSSGLVELGTWTVPVATPPSITASATPQSGNSPTQVFQFSFSESSGYYNLPWAQVLINSGLSGERACYIHYHQDLNLIDLLNDSQTAAVGPLAVGGVGAMQNGQCVVDASRTSVTKAGNTLTLSIAITFKSAFGGYKTIYARASTRAGFISDWRAIGERTVPNSGTSLSVSPAQGIGRALAVTVVYTSPAGPALEWLEFLANATLEGKNGCRVYYNRSLNLFDLYNDSQTGAVGPVVPGASTTIENGQCVLDAFRSSAVVSGSSVTLMISLTFKSDFIGPKNLYVRLGANQGVTSWVTLGMWVVN